MKGVLEALGLAAIGIMIGHLDVPAHY